MAEHGSLGTTKLEQMMAPMILVRLIDEAVTKTRQQRPFSAVTRADVMREAMGIGLRQLIRAATDAGPVKP